MVRQDGRMNDGLSALLSMVAKAGIILLVANEVRGFVLAVPVLYGLYSSGGTLMALWIAFCSIGGIVASVVGPLIVAKKLKLISR
jgi:hypothetical protein